MSKATKEFFQEGSLVCFKYEEMGAERQSVKQQWPGKVIGILKSSDNRDDVELLVAEAKVEHVPDPSPAAHGKTMKVWREGNIAKRKGKELHSFVPAQRRLQGGLFEPIPFDVGELPFLLDDNNDQMRKAWIEIRNLMAGSDLKMESMPLDDIIHYMYPQWNTEPHSKLVWAAWLHVKDDYFFEGTPTHIKYKSESHVEARDETKGSVNIKDMAEQEEREEARKLKSENIKEARKRVQQIMMLRNSSLLKAMTDREITNTVSKAGLQRFETGETIVVQGVDAGNLYVVIAGECDAIQRFGEPPFAIEERQFTLSPGNTFAEESILHIPSRMNVRALKPVEIAVIEVRYLEFLVNESPDALKSIQKLLNWQEDHKPVYDIIMQRKSLLLKNLKDHELKALAKYVTIKTFAKDSLLCREGDTGTSMFIVLRGYARAFNEIEISERAIERREAKFKGRGYSPDENNYFRPISANTKEIRPISADTAHKLSIGGQTDAMFSAAARAVFGARETDMHRHRHAVNVYRVGDCFEETAATLQMKRQSSIVVLQGSIIGEISKSDLSPILINNPTAHLEVKKYWQDVTPIVLVAEAVNKSCPSAMVPKLDQFEVRRLSLGAELVECNAGQVIMTVGKSSSSIFMVLEGELSVLQKEAESRNMVEIGVLRAGMSVGEVGLVTGGKCTSTVKCKTDCSLIEITSEAAEGLILSRPDLVEHVFLIKTVLAEQGEILELICDHIDRVNQLVLLESQERNLEEEGTKGDPPYFSSWSDGKTVEIVEISPPVYGNSPSARGRYERIEELLDVQLYKSMWRGFDTEWGMEIAWNRVFLAKLSPTVKMQFLSEVATTLILTNEQPSCLRYDLRETSDGSIKFLSKWEMSKALQVDAFKPGYLSPRSRPLGEEIGQIGMKQNELESATHVEAWRALRPFETEKPSDWDDDEIPEKFMTKEMIAAKRAKPERVFHAPAIIKCFNYWEEEQTNSMVFITELIEGTKGVGPATRREV